VAADRQIEPEEFITDVIALVTDSLDVGLLRLSRLEGDTMRYDRVHDRMGMSLPAGTGAGTGTGTDTGTGAGTGTVAPLAVAYRATMLDAAAPALVVEDTRADSRFAHVAQGYFLSHPLPAAAPIARAGLVKRGQRLSRPLRPWLTSPPDPSRGSAVGARLQGNRGRRLPPDPRHPQGVRAVARAGRRSSRRRVGERVHWWYSVMVTHPLSLLAQHIGRYYDYAG